jgi:predicted Zn finger-like uncharacterized protein
MIVSCPSCKTKFAIDDALIKSRFQKMKCSRCHHIFSYEREPDVPEEAKAEEPEVKPPKRRLTVFLLVMLLLVAAAAGFYFYWVNYAGAGDTRLQIQKPEGQEIVLKDGRAFLINGYIHNGSTKARRFFRLRAKIFDRDGSPVGEKESLAGLVVTREEIQGVHKQEVQRRINEFRLAPIETFQADRDKELPFALIFTEGEFAKVKTFSVEIIDSPPL